jgi:hypothetical protein
MRMLFVVAMLLVGCPMEPRERPDVACADACKKRVPACNEHQCDRGCAFILDRLVEREQDTVLQCMGVSHGCNDPEWANCAVRVGAHADGGPPPPAPLEPEEH